MAYGYMPLTFPDGATKDVWIYQAHLNHAVVYFSGATGPEGYHGWEILSMHKSFTAAEKAVKAELERQTRNINSRIEEGWYDPAEYPAYNFEIIKF